MLWVWQKKHGKTGRKNDDIFQITNGPDDEGYFLFWVFYSHFSRKKDMERQTALKLAVDFKMNFLLCLCSITIMENIIKTKPLRLINLCPLNA